MLFYQIEALSNNKLKVPAPDNKDAVIKPGSEADNNDNEMIDENPAAEALGAMICNRSLEFLNEHLSFDSYFFVVDISGLVVSFGLILTKKSDLALFDAYARKLGFDIAEKKTIKEITALQLRELLGKSYQSFFTIDCGTILEHYGLELNYYEFGESLISEASRSKIRSEAKKTIAAETLIPEIERILSKKTAKYIPGHPVHYLLEGDDINERGTVWHVILQALYRQNRIISKRFSYLNISPSRERSQLQTLKSLYKISEGGSIIISFCSEDEEETDLASFKRGLIEGLCKLWKKYHHSVLTVLCLPKQSSEIRKTVYDYLNGITLVEIHEAPLNSDNALCFIKKCARDKKIAADSSLTEIVHEGRYYSHEELLSAFEKWYDSKIKNEIYTAYSDLKAADPVVYKKQTNGSAYDELMSMIGLSEAKQTINGIIDYFKARQLYKNRGFNAGKPTMHLAFVGNPGTAKTTVARLLTGIFKENGIVTSGAFVECGRVDLVDRFVGGTAPKVKRKFEEARGGCLFLDEIYSLVDDRKGSFGDEAINTIVQEMENHRDEVVVIFAGYPEKMEKLLTRNPGLRSRIAFLVNFNDYNADELTGIAKLLVKQRRMMITNDACEKLTAHFKTMDRDPDFGNGRYVRNIIDRAEMAHAARLINMDQDGLTDEAIITITADDVVVPGITDFARESVHKIGYCT